MGRSRSTCRADKVFALYARGLTVREILAFLREMSAVGVSPDLISTVTDAIVAEVLAWQSRPLEPRYAVVFFDALRVKIRDEAENAALAHWTSNTTSGGSDSRRL